MIALFLFFLAVVFTMGELAYRRNWHYPKTLEVFISYLFFFNMGLMGILAAYAHVFMGAETAAKIGWAPGSPFQFEIGMANLSYGILGVLAYWFRGRFWDASAVGWSILLLGCFVGHLIDYFLHGNNAPYNIGILIWFHDLLLPILLLTLLYVFRNKQGAHPSRWQDIS